MIFPKTACADVISRKGITDVYYCEMLLNALHAN